MAVGAGAEAQGSKVHPGWFCSSSTPTTLLGWLYVYKRLSLPSRERAGVVESREKRTNPTTAQPWISAFGAGECLRELLCRHHLPAVPGKDGFAYAKACLLVALIFGRSVPGIWRQEFVEWQFKGRKWKVKSHIWYLVLESGSGWRCELQGKWRWSTHKEGKLCLAERNAEQRLKILQIFVLIVRCFYKICCYWITAEVTEHSNKQRVKKAKSNYMFHAIYRGFQGIFF